VSLKKNSHAEDCADSVAALYHRLFTQQFFDVKLLTNSETQKLSAEELRRLTEKLENNLIKHGVIFNKSNNTVGYDLFSDNKNIVSSKELHESVIKAFIRQK
jgi:hypothetical protein